MKKIIKVFLICIFSLCLCTPVYALNIPESIDEYILDDANIIEQDTEEYITEKNWLMDQHCGGYVEIVTEDYINCDIADYSYELFNEWQIGGAEHNNGILMVLVPQEDKFYVMYGRGYETDVKNGAFQETVNDIVTTYLEPKFDAQQYDEAVRETYDALYQEMCNVYGTPQDSYYGDDDYYYDDYNYNHYNRGDTSIFSIILYLFSTAFSFMGTIIFIIILIYIISKMSRRRRRYYGGAYRPYRSHYVDPGVHHSRPSSSFGSGPSHSSSHSFGGGHSSSHSSSHSFGGGHSSSHSSGGSHSFGGRSSGGGSRGGGAGRR